MIKIICLSQACIGYLRYINFNLKLDLLSLDLLSLDLLPLARKLTSIFKVFQRQINNFHLKGRFFSGVKSFWVIQDKQPVLKSINNINKRRCAKSISTFDFSTLYTNLPHDKLKYVLHHITDFCWKGCSGYKIRVSDHGAYWSKGMGKNKDKDWVHPRSS